jgi:4-hydroxybenzoate polyprenyltransferase
MNGRSTSTEGRQRLLTGVAAVSALALSATLGRHAWGLLAICAVLACLYSVPLTPGARRLRDFGLAKIAVLAGVWTLVTAVIPVMDHADPATLVQLALRRFLFMLALCLAFDVRDLDVDARRGVHTLAVRLGAERSYVLIRLLLGCFAAASLLLPVGEPPRLAPGITAGLVASSLLTWLIVERTRRRGSNALYLAGIDGMMLAQSLLVGLGSVWFHA